MLVLTNSDEDKYERTHFCEHEMTEAQKMICEKMWERVCEWFEECQKDCDISEDLEKTYEDRFGKSCVLWAGTDENSDMAWGDSLPRTEDYQTDGYTDEFNKWATDIIAKAVVDGDCKTMKEASDAIRALCNGNR